jgi:hypothetical protein
MSTTELQVRILAKTNEAAGKFHHIHFNVSPLSVCNQVMNRYFIHCNFFWVRTFDCLRIVNIIYYLSLSKAAEPTIDAEGSGKNKANGTQGNHYNH